MSGSTFQFEKVVLCITEEWFAYSHFRPLIEVLTQISRNVTVVARRSGTQQSLAELPVKVIAFDYQRSSMNPIGEIQSARRLAHILRQENPDVVHLIAMKPIVLGAVATALASVNGRVLHVTGIGYLASLQSLPGRMARKMAFRAITTCLKRPGSWLATENPHDLNYLIDQGVRPANTPLRLGGAGIDPGKFHPNKKTTNPIPNIVVACRMIRSKGVHDVVTACQQLLDQGIDLTLSLFGDVDNANPDSYTRAEVLSWCEHPNISWFGHVNDPLEIWKTADIAVLATRDREGLPKTLLEAAAMQCPLVVTDIPGSRDLVRDHIDGLVVPPDAPDQLGVAIKKLLLDPTLRSRLGTSARHRVLAQFTEEHFKNAIRDLYNQISETQKTSAKSPR